jgi:hypothetical protein
MSKHQKRKHSDSITSSDYNSGEKSVSSAENISPRTSSPIPEELQLIKCFQLIVYLPEKKNALMNIKNFISVTEITKFATIKIHAISEHQWIFIVPENEKTFYLCSEISSGKYSNGILKGLTFDYKFPCNQKYYNEYFEMYSSAKDVSAA